ncbi:MAG: imelysin family protein [Gammaproteobacteria bacterium]
MQFIKASSTLVSPARALLGFSSRMVGQWALIPAVALCLGAMVAPAAEALDGAHGVNVEIARTQIVPSYERFAEAAADFQTAVQSACDSGVSDDEALRKAYPAVVDAWMRAEIWRFGPVEYLTRRTRIWYWPDKHGRSAKQIRLFLQAATAESLEARRFADGSVALQGLPAFERLVFAETPAADAGHVRFRCDYLAAIANNIHAMSADIVENWTRPDEGSLAMIETSEGGNASYEDGAAQVTTELVKSLNTALISIVELKLARPMGDSLKRARPKRGESWRAGLGLANIRANLEALQALYGVEEGTGLSALLGSVGEQAHARDLDQRIRAGFRDAIARIDAIDATLADAVSDADKRSQLVILKSMVADLVEMTGGELPGLLGVNLGFNALDGD